MKSVDNERMTPEHAPQTRATLADHLTTLRRRKWIVLVPVLLVPIVAYAYAAQQPKLYGASSEVLLSRENIGLSLAGITNADVYTDPDRYAETEATLARVPEVARRAIQLAGVDDMRPGELLDSSAVIVRGNADLLNFTVDNQDAEAAARLAGAYARAYSRFRQELDTASLTSARKDLERSSAELDRRGLIDSPLYRELTRRAQELRTLEILQAGPKVVRIPGDAVQVAPAPRRSAMLAAALGLLLGVGAAFLWDKLDRRLRDEDEIQRTLAIPLLARLPAPMNEGGRHRLAMLENPSGSEAEAIRRFRSNIEFANLDQDANVIMVTSALSGEGKSVTVSNLGAALARGGRRVVLVDLDLRKPTVGKLFGLGYRAGLTDVSIERVTLDDALVPVALETESPVQFASRRSLKARQVPVGVPDEPKPDAAGTLAVLPAGFVPASPGELVGTHAVANVLEELRGRFDYVLVDAPPLLAVSDAVTLSRRVDAVVVVVRLGMVDRSDLRELARQLDGLPSRKLGFVLAGAEHSDLYGAYGASERATADLQPAGYVTRSETEAALEQPAGGRSRR